MYILVIGSGKVGYQLIRALMAEEHEVLAIDVDPARCAQLIDEMGSVALVGDGSEVGVLREAGANRADVLIAATGADEDNLVACQIAKHMFHVGRTIALINDSRNEALFEQLGVDVTVSTSDMILKSIEEELPAHPLVHVMPLRIVNRNVLEIRVPPEAAVVGRELGEVSLPPDTLVPLVIRGTQATPATPEMRLRGHDELVVIAAPEQEAELLRAFTEER
jgi:trk system potassium uptake protein TrkA